MWQGHETLSEGQGSRSREDEVRFGGLALAEASFSPTWVEWVFLVAGRRLPSNIFRLVRAYNGTSHVWVHIFVELGDALVYLFIVHRRQVRVWLREHVDESEGWRRGWKSCDRRHTRMDGWRCVWDDDASNFPVDETLVHTGRTWTVFLLYEFSVNNHQPWLHHHYHHFLYICSICYFRCDLLLPSTTAGPFMTMSFWWGSVLLFTGNGGNVGDTSLAIVNSALLATRMHSNSNSSQECTVWQRSQGSVTDITG